MRFRDRLARFFWGRNGIDAMYYGLFAGALLLWIIRAFFRGNDVADAVIGFVSSLLLVYMFFRVLSRNLAARRRENQIFLSLFARSKNFFVLQKNKIKDRKYFVYRKCPSCKANLRLPKKKGEHTVRCPKCSNRFEVRVR